MGKDDVLKEIEENQPLDKQKIDKFMNDLVKELKELSPDFTPYQSKPPEYKEVAQLIIDSLNNSDSLVIKFAEICQQIAISNNSDCAKELYDHQFSKIAQLFNGQGYDFSCDYFKIIGKRLFLIFISCLINRKEWDLIGEILEN